MAELPTDTNGVEVGRVCGLYVRMMDIAVIDGAKNN